MKKLLIILLLSPLFSLGQSTPKLFFGSYQMDSLYSALNVKTDCTLYKPVVMGSDNQYHKLNRWPTGSGGSGGINYITASKSYVGVTSGVGANGTSGGSGTGGMANKNILIGDETGNAFTTGRLNFGLGNQVLKVATILSDAIAIGDSALLKDIQYADGSIAIGKNAGQEYVGSSGMTPFVAIGKSALRSHTTPSAGTSSNGAIGYRALELCTTCSENFAMGEQALGSNLTGNSSTAMGMFALRDATGGTNTAMGNRALLNLTTATGNTGVGASTGGTLAITGVGNTMVGNAATLAAVSTANGVSIGASAKVGTSGVAVGQGTVQTAGTGTVSVGNSILQTSGDYNNYMGYGASNSGATGSYNTSIRVYMSNTSILTGNHNTTIGSDVTVLSQSGSNQFALGGNAIRWMVMDVSGSARRTVINGSTTTVTATTASAALDVRSTLGGFLTPVHTTTQMNAVSSPATGLEVYNSDYGNKMNYNGVSWAPINSNNYIAKSATYTVLNTDYLVDCTSGTFTVTLPTAVAFTGKQFIVKNSGAGAITIQGNQNGIATFNTITGGSGYTNGTHTGVALTGGTGTGAIATVTVTGTAVTGVTITTCGKNYTVADVLTGTVPGGSGWSVPVLTLITQTIDGGTYSLATQYKQVTVTSNGTNFIVTSNN